MSNNFMDYGLGYYGQGCAGNNFSKNGTCFTPGGPSFTEFVPGVNVVFSSMKPAEKLAVRNARRQVRVATPKQAQPTQNCNDPDTVGVL